MKMFTETSSGEVTVYHGSFFFCFVVVVLVC